MRAWPTCPCAQSWLGLGDVFVAELADQLVGGGPGFVVGLAHDHVQAHPERTWRPWRAARARTSAIFRHRGGGSPQVR
jgi:hypothetical protein